VLPRSLARVNTVVMLHSAVPLALADIARSAGLAYTPAESALTTLIGRGLVASVNRAGRERFGPNPDSPYYPMAYLTALVDLPLAEAFGDESISVAYAYGPLARPGGAAKGMSLNLLLVGQIHDFPAMLTRLVLMGARLGRAVVPFVVTDAEFERARRTGDGHVAAALDGVRLPGKPRTDPTP
jgi:hypothetical protein